jgi:hypothetical protein
MSYFNKQLQRLPDEMLFDLENRLLEPLFMGVPIGLTLTSYLNKQLPINPVDALKAVLGWLKFVWFGHRECQNLPHLEGGRVLLTWLANTPRLNDLVLPIVNELGSAQCNVIGGEKAIRDHISHEAGFCTKYQICKVDMGDWRREYRRCCGIWHRQILRWLREHRLPLWLFPQLAYALAARSLFIYGSFRFLEVVQPTVILTESEHNYPWACLILAAKHMKIPTIQMIHCAIYTSYIFYPLLSDVALCWGEQQREQMLSFGVSPERLLITGCQRLTRVNQVDGAQVRTRLGLPQKIPVIMLATNPIAREKWRKQVFTFGDAMHGCPDLTGVVRLHPVEKLDNYREEVAQYPWIRFFESQQWTLEESMAACDVVVSHNSGVGNDALVMGRTVVVLDVLGEPMSNGQVLADKAGCPIVKNAPDLRQAVRRILSDQTYRDMLLIQAENYVLWFCSAYGKDAARNVAKEIKKHMDS